MKKILMLILSVIMLLTGTVALPVYAGTAPKATSLTSVSAGVKSFTAKWKKVSGDGYQLQYSTDSGFKNAKNITISSASAVTKKVKGLKAKKKYYVRIRTKKGNKYAKWSKVRTVTTKASSAPKKSGCYITPTGACYHFDKDCAGKNAIPISLKDAKAKGYRACKKCAGG